MPLAMCITLSSLVGILAAYFDPRIQGFLHTSGAVLAFVLVPALGIFIGNLLRLWLRPDVVLGTTQQVIGARIFWAIGPQFIGWMVGFIAASNLAGLPV
ncbi:TPA: permease [Yersinia enterocolitica]|uniref:Permease n=2 Tax=Yersinia TaxID=629 RepID=A0A380Q3T5_YERPU|nr:MULTISPECIES: permease [Yersinia]CNI00973.1 Uncharacterised protein [Yersinia kristensenii]AIN13420.1 putative membrane protein [Yersinia pseudotuberculosis]AJJ05707.1 putative membrane protein [Yersinia pseudotuberculosis]EKN3584866.1 permease [Yersinia enterocolitica]EKN4720550.1 permease [Yersinia enterocolitica]